MTKSILVIFIFLLALPLKSIASDFICRHFWITPNGRLESTKEIGRDLGQNLKYKNGVYECDFHLSEEDHQEVRYLYIGEVGDASYVKIKREGSKEGYRLFRHGLSPNSKIPPSNLRLIPFFLQLNDFSDGPGKYKLELYYRSILDHHNGLRSGLPTIENIKTIAVRIVSNSTAFTLSMAAIVFLLFMLASTLISAKISKKKKLSLIGAIISSILVISSISGIPRMIYPSPYLLRLNTCFHALCYLTYFLAISEFFSFKKSRLNFFIKNHWVIAVSYIVIELSISERTNLTLISLALFMTATSWLFVFQIIKGRVEFNASTVTPLFVPLGIFIFGGMYLYDNINFTLLENWSYYSSQFITGPFIVFLIEYMSKIETHEFAFFLEKMSKIKDQTLKILSFTHNNESAILDSFTKELGLLIGAKRVSVLELSENNLMFMGSFGTFRDTNEITQMQNPSYIHDAFEKQRIVRGYAVKEPCQEFIILPVTQGKDINGFVCVTNFVKNSLPAFIEKNVDHLISESSIVVNLAITRRRMETKTALLETMRATVHPLQIKSEEYFLKFFRVNESNKGHSFIIGDLVGSTPLNELFGSENVANAMDEYLFSVWDSHKDLGIVLNRTKGDAVSILVPNLLTDQDQLNSVKKAFSILQELNDNRKLESIARKHGVLAPMYFRFVMGKISTQVQEAGQVKSFNLLADPAIDGATRILDNIVKPNECILTEAAKTLLPSSLDITEVSPERLRGKFKNIRCYSLSKTMTDTQESA